MHTTHSFHFPHLSVIQLMMNRQLREIYLAIAIRAFGFSMIGIFVPLFMLNELGFDFSKVLVFYLLFVGVFALSTIPAAMLSGKIGLKHTILLTTPLYLVYYALIYFMKSNAQYFFIAAAVGGLAESLFWISFHVDFTRFTDIAHRGEQVGFFFGLTVIASLIGPFIGALILTFIGFKALFLITGVILLCSAPVLLASKDSYTPQGIAWSKIFTKHNAQDIFNHIALGVRIIAEGLIWPIYLFLILNAYLALGFIITLSTLFGAFSSYAIGKYADATNKRTVLKTGTVVYALSWFARMIANTKFPATLITLLTSFFSPLLDVPLNAMTYDRAQQKKQVVEYFVFREISINIGKALCIASVLYLANMKMSFLVTAIATLIHFFF